MWRWKTRSCDVWPCRLTWFAFHNCINLWHFVVFPCACHCFVGHLHPNCSILLFPVKLLSFSIFTAEPCPLQFAMSLYSFWYMENRALVFRNGFSAMSQPWTILAFGCEGHNVLDWLDSWSVVVPWGSNQPPQLLVKYSWLVCTHVWILMSLQGDF